MMMDKTEFLKSVVEFNEKYVSIHIGNELQSLYFPFWSWDKIQTGLSLRKDWGVQETLTPFYGDWHDLICLNKKNGTIIYINDAREIEYKWKSIENFVSCLSVEEVEEVFLKDPPILISQTGYSPEFEKRMRDLIKKKNQEGQALESDVVYKHPEIESFQKLSSTKPWWKFW